jgi:hypothetical protein
MIAGLAWELAPLGPEAALELNAEASLALGAIEEATCKPSM